MGCCGSKSNQEDSSSLSTRLRPNTGEFNNNLSKNKNQRYESWERTGIVGLRDANLKEIPQEVLELGKGVRNLDATNNSLVALPPAFGNLTQINRLVLGSNKLLALPAEIGQLWTLKVLVLDSNCLSALPEEMGQLVRLEKLTVSHNQLTSLPDSIGELKKLNWLDVGHNKMSYLPSGLGRCIALETLLAQNNNLLDLPAELGALSRLKEMKLDNNNICTIPSTIFTNCTSLQTLTLHSNPVNEDILLEVDGFTNFQQRVKAKFDRQIDAGVLINRQGLDDGLDHHTTRIVVPST